MYLQQSLKGGSAKGAIEGLSRSGEYYAEAVESLQARYDRPRLIHQAHVHMILEAPALVKGNGKELRCLHDTVQQYLRALKAMDREAPGPFITSVLELKLDSSTMFEWQKTAMPFHTTTNCWISSIYVLRHLNLYLLLGRDPHLPMHLLLHNLSRTDQLQ